MERFESDFVESVVLKYGKNLSSINLSNNGLKHLENIEKFGPSLTKLDLSKNEIKDIYPLKKLYLLEDLNISDNKIDHLPRLESLINLCCFDLSYNNISNIESIESIGELPSLKILRINGNPICSSIEFPGNIFELNSNLEQVDGWNRDDFLKVKDSKWKGNKSEGKESHLSEDISYEIQKYQSKIESLEFQIQSLNEVFELQEKVLHRNGSEHSKMNLEKSIIDGTIKNSQEILNKIESFPFHDLLKSWRKKVLHCLFVKKSLESQLDSTTKKFKKERSSFLNQIREYESNVLIWKQKFLALDEQCEYFKKNAEQSDQKLSNEKLKNEKLSSENESLKSLIQKLSKFLLKYKQIVEKNCIEYDAIGLEMREKLIGYERKLMQMKERVYMAELVIAQNDVQLRNSMAALEVERSLLNRKGIDSTTNKTNESVDSNDAQNPNCYYLSDIDISPEKEALLGSIFRNLDPLDSGIIDIRYFLACVIESFEIEDQKNETDFEQIDRIKSFLSQPNFYEIIYRQIKSSIKSTSSSQFSPPMTTGSSFFYSDLGVLLNKAFGVELFAHILKGILSDSDSKLTYTWGEFLMKIMLLSKESQVDEMDIKKNHFHHRAALSQEEIRELQQEGLMGNFDWGFIHLVLPTMSKSHPNMAKPTIEDVKRCEPFHYYSSSSWDETEEEKRLKAERKYLLKKIQEMNRTLEKRAEMIKYYFEDSLKKAKLKESKMEIQIRELKDVAEKYSIRIEELNESNNQIKSHFEARVTSLEKENDELKTSIRDHQNKNILKYEDSLSKEVAKSSKIEAELTICQRELSKKEVKCKALQRDIITLQTSQTSQSKECQELKKTIEQLTRKNSELEIEFSKQIKNSKQEWEEEKDELTTKISELQTLLSTSQKELSELKNQNIKSENVSPNFPTPSQSTQAKEASTSSQAATNPTDSVKEQIEFIKSQAVKNGLSHQDKIKNYDIYLAQLDKLVRLAEEAMN